MSPSLPKHPSLEHLKKSAKQLLAAQRHGHAQCCPLLRRLNRFAEASDSEILAARVSLSETQFIVAMHFGFQSWEHLRRHIRAQRTTNENSLEAVALRCREEIPEYAGAGVALGVVAALNHAGVDLDFMEFAAASGWAFSFGYRYDSISPAYMAVRGRPDRDGPFEVFAFLPGQYGFGYEMAKTSEHESLWNFVKRYVDAATPIMSEHMDGGLITGYQEQDGRRQLYFDGTVASGWMDVDELQPHAVYVLTRQRPARPREEITGLALKRAVAKGSAHHWDGTPQGMAALEAYLADVADVRKDFAKVEEWFCWAAFERLIARRCCAVWLRSAAEEVPRQARDSTLAAAGLYARSFECYDRFCGEVCGNVCVGEPTAPSLQQRARTPERIAVLVPLLQEGIAAEVAGLDALRQAVGRLR